MASLKDRIARCKEELEARRLDGKVLGLLGAAEGRDGAVEARLVEDLRQELKRKKFLYLAVEAQLRFLGGCQQSDLATLECASHGRDLVGGRREAKERNQALKRDIAKETEEHAKLRQQLAEVSREAARKFDECEQDLRNLSALMEEQEQEDLDTLRESAEALAALSGSARGGAEVEEALRLLQEQPQEAAKRRKLEDELRSLEQDRRAFEDTFAELTRKEAWERQEIERLQGLARLEGELGLPQIEFDDAKGVVVLGPPSAEGSDDDLALRTVRLEHDAQGRLVRAEPHPSLGLWNEGTVSVEKDDLARLLTLVWDRLCEQRQQRRQQGGRVAGGVGAVDPPELLGGA